MVIIFLQVQGTGKVGLTRKYKLLTFAGRRVECILSKSKYSAELDNEEMPETTPSERGGWVGGRVFNLA